MAYQSSAVVRGTRPASTWATALPMPSRATSTALLFKGSDFALLNRLVVEPIRSRRLSEVVAAYAAEALTRRSVSCWPPRVTRTAELVPLAVCRHRPAERPGAGDDPVRGTISTRVYPGGHDEITRVRSSRPMMTWRWNRSSGPFSGRTPRNTGLISTASQRGASRGRNLCDDRHDGRRGDVLDDPALGTPCVERGPGGRRSLWARPTSSRWMPSSPLLHRPHATARSRRTTPRTPRIRLPRRGDPDRAGSGRRGEPHHLHRHGQDAALFLIAHGDSDCLVPNQQSQILHEALEAAGATSRRPHRGRRPRRPGDHDLAAPIALEMLKSVFGK